MTAAQHTQPLLSTSPVARNPPSLGRGFGVIRAFRRDPLEFLCRAARTHGDVVHFGFGPANAYQLRHPDHVQHVLVDHNRNYDKQTRGYDALRLFLRNGLLTSEGDFWRRQRRIAQPAFHRKRIAAFGQTMVDASLAMLEGWARAEHDGTPLDIEDEMTALTLRIVTKTLLDTEVTESGSTIGRAVTQLNHKARELMMNPFATPIWLPTPKNLRYQKSAAALDSVVRGIITERRQTGEDRGDLLSMLMQATDVETGESMSDEQLRDEVMTIFLAGHETTANALAWTFYLLSTHPYVQRRVRAELADVLGGRAPTMDDLPSLPYLKQVVQESMRLYPPAWSIGRRAIEDDVIGGYRIAKGSLILLSPYVTHRDPRFWPNPEGFDPERFAPGRDHDRPKYAYYPFGGGPRLCIGNNFALMEAQLVLATVLPRFEPCLVPGHPVVTEPLITLRPRFGMPMTIRPAMDA